MKKQGLLHPELCRTITAMGHTDTLVVADAGLPIPNGIARIDLALVPGMPGFLTTLEAILAEFEVDQPCAPRRSRPTIHRCWPACANS